MAQTAMTVRMDNQQKEVKPQSSRLMKCKYPLNSVLHISKKYCTFARRHHFSNFDTRIRNLALHQHKLMEVIP